MVETVYTCLLSSSNTLAGQKAVLRTSSIRKNLDKMKGDSASLVVHYDSSSIVSKMTDNLSKLSMVFGFDSTLFVTNVYQRTLQTSYKQSLKWQWYADNSNRMMKQIDNSPFAPTRSSNITKHEIIVWDLYDYARGLRQLRQILSEKLSTQHSKYMLWALLLLVQECEIEMKTAEHKAYYHQLERYFNQNRLDEPLPDLINGSFLPLWNDPAVASKRRSTAFQKKHIALL